MSGRLTLSLAPLWHYYTICGAEVAGPPAYANCRFTRAATLEHDLPTPTPASRLSPLCYAALGVSRLGGQRSGFGRTGQTTNVIALAPAIDITPLLHLPLFCELSLLATLTAKRLSDLSTDLVVFSATAKSSLPTTPPLQRVHGVCLRGSASGMLYVSIFFHLPARSFGATDVGTSRFPPWEGVMQPPTTSLCSVHGPLSSPSSNSSRLHCLTQ